MSLTARVLGVVLVLAITALVVVSTLVGTEQEWGLRHRPFPVLLLPLAECIAGSFFALGVWRLRGAALGSVVACFVAALGLLWWLSQRVG